MRFFILFLILVVMGGGCASNFVRDESRAVASRIGITDAEVAALAQQVSARYKRPIAWIRMSVAVTDAFEVGLSDQPGSPHGIVVIFRKMDGRWQEDPSLQLTWIV